MKEPALRPKGLGLGANKMANAEKKPKTSEELELTLVKGAFAKITAGHNKGLYCQVLLISIFSKPTVTFSVFYRWKDSMTKLDELS